MRMYFKHVRRFAAILLLFALATGLIGCSRLVPAQPESVSIYATCYPIYALSNAVVRDVPDLSLHCLIQPQDGCLRDYALSDWDAALLSGGADAVIAGGCGLESFESTLFGWGEEGPAISAVLYNLDLYSAEESNSTDPDAESHLTGNNPHLYMSLDGAEQIVESISAMMVSMDPQYADDYIQNAQSAEAALDALLAQNRALLAPYKGQKVILMNEALIYTALDYDLDVAEWIDRESGETMSADALDRCLEQLAAAECRVVLIEKHAPGALVEALEAAGYCVAGIDVLSTHAEGEGFDRYLQIQGENARALQEALERANTGKEVH